MEMNGVPLYARVEVNTLRPRYNDVSDDPMSAWTVTDPNPLQFSHLSGSLMIKITHQPISPPIVLAFQDVLPSQRIFRF